MFLFIPFPPPPQLLCYCFSAALPMPQQSRTALPRGTQEHGWHKGPGLGTSGFGEQTGEQRAKHKAAEEGRLKNNPFWAGEQAAFYPYGAVL